MQPDIHFDRSLVWEATLLLNYREFLGSCQFKTRTKQKIIVYFLTHMGYNKFSSERRDFIRSFGRQIIVSII